MADTNFHVPNVMPDAMVEPITDMELTVAKLKYAGEINKNAKADVQIPTNDREV